MAAAEKLKVLEAWFADEANFGASWADASSELVVVLPQIVAVVEALQRTNQHLDGYIGYESHELIGMNAAALAALDEALP